MDIVSSIRNGCPKLAAVLLLNSRRKEFQMGPIGVLGRSNAQIIHMLIMLIALPFILIAKIFGGGKD